LGRAATPTALPHLRARARLPAGRTSLEESSARAGEAEAAVEGVDEVQLVVRDVLEEDGAERRREPLRVLG
jgi:hypothetical protein